MIVVIFKITWLFVGNKLGTREPKDLFLDIPEGAKLSTKPKCKSPDLLDDLKKDENLKQPPVEEEVKKDVETTDDLLAKQKLIEEENKKRAAAIAKVVADRYVICTDI